ESASPDQASADKSEEANGTRTERPGRPAKKKKRPLGPMVVVKRLSGMIETRPATPSQPEASPTPTAPVEPSAGGEPPAPATDDNASRLGEAGSAGASPEPEGAEEAQEKESFAELFAASTKHEGGMARRMPRVGEKVSATIFQLGAETAFATLPSKHEAMIELDELKDEEGILRLGVGDVLEAYVIEAGAKGIYLSKSLPKGMATLEMLAA